MTGSAKVSQASAVASALLVLLNRHELISAGPDVFVAQPIFADHFCFSRDARPDADLYVADSLLHWVAGSKFVALAEGELALLLTAGVWLVLPMKGLHGQYFAQQAAKHRVVHLRRASDLSWAGVLPVYRDKPAQQWAWPNRNVGMVRFVGDQSLVSETRSLSAIVNQGQKGA